jgi:predicted dinucleotide-binding enzyme
MTTTIIGTGGLGSVIARQLASGGEALLAVLFYVTDDDRAGEEVERLIRTAGSGAERGQLVASRVRASPPSR